MKTFTQRLVSIVLFGASWLLGAGAHADTYILEVVLFSQPSAQWQQAEPPHWSWADQATLLEQSARSDLRGIDSSRHQLQRDAERLTGNGYQVLLHRAWEQPADPDLQVAVHAGESRGDLYPAQGLVSLSSQGALQVDLEFWLNRDQGSEHLQQSRRLRLNETHYLDHQSLGMLVRVWR